MTDETMEILPAIYNEMPVVLKTRDGREIKYIRPDEVQKILSFLEGRDRVFVEHRGQCDRGPYGYARPN